MRLSVKNIGKIRSAEVEINGITVIAGENDTGKSTVGKALFAVFNTLYHMRDRVNLEKKLKIKDYISMLYGSLSPRYDDKYMHMAMDIVDLKNEKMTPEEFQSKLYELLSKYDPERTSNLEEEELSFFSERVIMTLNIENQQIIENIIQRRLEIEFNEQIGNIYVPGEKSEICLEVRKKPMTIRLENDVVISVDHPQSLETETMYLDDPFVIDEVSQRLHRVSLRYGDHRDHLINSLILTKSSEDILEEILTGRKLENIYRKISSVCEGDFIRDKGSDLSYRMPSSDKKLHPRNLSTGMKTFAILKLLLLKGKIEENGTIILDEPEIHLHPEWQLLFAELIVLLHKEFGLHVLLNTHSPYFLNAIEVYAAKYEVHEKCKYYLAQNVDRMSEIMDVTHNIEEIYRRLARPFQKLENERYSDD